MNTSEFFLSIRTFKLEKNEPLIFPRERAYFFSNEALNAKSCDWAKKVISKKVFQEKKVIMKPMPTFVGSTGFFSWCERLKVKCEYHLPLLFILLRWKFVTKQNLWAAVLEAWALKDLKLWTLHLDRSKINFFHRMLSVYDGLSINSKVKLKKKF